MVVDTLRSNIFHVKILIKILDNIQRARTFAAAAWLR